MSTPRAPAVDQDEILAGVGIPLSTAEFRSFQALILAATGISLADGKRYLLASRLAGRLRELVLA